MRVCVQCKADISAPELRRKVFCPDCTKARRKAEKLEYRQQLREQKGNRICVICEKEFPRSGQVKACSPECKKEQYRIHHATARANQKAKKAKTR